MLLVFLLCSLWFGLVEGCRLVDTKIHFDLHGYGFHRTLRTEVNVSSTVRFINCRLTYLFQIPQGAYMDVDELKSNYDGHCFVGSRFDTEKPQGPEIAQLQPIYFHSKRMLRKVFIFGDSIAVPVHLRYHRPTADEDDRPTVKFDAPRVYLRCEENETLLAESSCKRQLEKIPCGCSQKPKCSALRLSLSSLPSAETEVPVGDRDHLVPVSIATLTVIVACILYLAYHTLISTKELSSVEFRKKIN